MTNQSALSEKKPPLDAIALCAGAAGAALLVNKVVKTRWVTLGSPILRKTEFSPLRGNVFS